VREPTPPPGPSLESLVVRVADSAAHRKAIQVRPDHAEAHSHLGNALKAKESRSRGAPLPT
jgi:hypothetical protein